MLTETQRTKQVEKVIRFRSVGSILVKMYVFTENIRDVKSLVQEFLESLNQPKFRNRTTVSLTEGLSVYKKIGCNKLCCRAIEDLLLSALFYLYWNPQWKWTSKSAGLTLKRSFSLRPLTLFCFSELNLMDLDANLSFIVIFNNLLSTTNLLKKSFSLSAQEIFVFDKFCTFVQTVFVLWKSSHHAGQKNKKSLTLKSFVLWELSTS